MIATLSTEDVLAIHEQLASDFAETEDPIAPAGLRSRDLLESAVYRQFIGYRGIVKFNTAILNAASLAYGICLNHPFHNGNKRTSLVALLCHLDKNDFTFEESVSQDVLYKFMIDIASHVFAHDQTNKPYVDKEVEEIAKWIRKRTRRVESGERIVTFRELKRILSFHGFTFENPQGNAVDIVRYEEAAIFFGLRRKQIRRRVMKMGNPGDGKTVARGELKAIRKACRLTEIDGFDSHAFYANTRPVDYFVTRYRTTLRRLARA